jgi:hypothetical protein
MKKWQAYIEKGTPDNMDNVELLYGNTFEEVLQGLIEWRRQRTPILVQNWKHILFEGASVNIWYGELAE